mmetsp:Transcript_28948/g.46470  ORF Transcript_28948/g.46470 Transcript_28948/m.46470 type:complete len:236 (+) Transcript_28948:416-1123(+)
MQINVNDLLFPKHAMWKTLQKVSEKYVLLSKSGQDATAPKYQTKKGNRGKAQAFSEKDDDGFDFGDGIEAVQERKKSSTPPVVPEKKRIVRKEIKTGGKGSKTKSKKRSSSRKRGAKKKDEGTKVVTGPTGIQPNSRADILGLNVKSDEGDSEVGANMEKPNLLISIFGKDGNEISREGSQDIAPTKPEKQLQVPTNASSNKRNSFDDFNPFEHSEKHNDNASNETKPNDYNPFR